MFNDFVYVFVKVGCGFRFSLRKKSESSTHPTTPGFPYVRMSSGRSFSGLQILQSGFFFSLISLKIMSSD